MANARFAKPLDLELLAAIAAMTPRILTLEEHLAMGGFGSAVLETFHAEGWNADGLKIHAIPDQFVEHSPQAVQRAALRLDAAGVAAKALELYPELEHSAARGPAGPSGGVRPRIVEAVTW